uniref:Uncharacterized protein n=1 Tax=Rhizophora mucronata TaxID=61149 RepID=A0A2P2IIE2_RHIMU
MPTATKAARRWINKCKETFIALLKDFQPTESNVTIPNFWQTGNYKMFSQ